MKRLSLGKIAIATATFACTALLSFGWSEQRGASLSIDSAQARVGRPFTPVSVAGVARRQYRRGAYGYGAGMVGAGAIGAAAVVATSPWGYQNAYGYGPGEAGAISPAGYYGNSGWSGGYYASSPWGDYACQPPHAYDCRPHAAKDWGRAW
jgi:hypothetical protein